MTSVSDRAHDTLLEAAGLWCSRLAAGDLPPAQQAEFETWIAEPGAADAFGRAAAAWRAIEAVAGEPELIAMRAAALHDLRTRQRGRWRRAAPMGRWLGPAIAAVLVLAVAAGLGWQALSPTTYATGVGERRLVVLTDGSRISLDADSRVDVRLSSHDRRLVLQRGRADFAVAHDPLRPFSVAAADKLVVATGTEFSVELLRRQVRVVLYQGHVAVLNAGSGPPTPLPLAADVLGRDAAGRESEAADQVLTPGRELVAIAGGDRAQVTAADPARSLAWTSGQLVFSDEPLASAVERVNRYTQAKLSVSDARAAATPVSGVFTAGDTAAFVEGITAVFPVRVVERDGARSFISTPPRS
ncbi:MAG: FecR domain-containing protein [Proteobacteria bacterium]|nr:FecR domain-containing protein [Pseudomonadota bacterium]